MTRAPLAARLRARRWAAARSPHAPGAPRREPRPAPENREPGRPRHVSAGGLVADWLRTGCGGNEPRNWSPNEGIHPLDGFAWGHADSHSLPSAPASYLRGKAELCAWFR